MPSDKPPAEKLVVGTGALLEWAVAAWTEISPETRLHAVDVGLSTDYRFDMSGLVNWLLTPASYSRTGFVAWGPQFLNFQRLELMGELKARGLKLPPLICRGATVANTAVLGENCSVGPGTIVGHGCKLGYNSFVGAGCILGKGAQVGHSAWIADGVQIGNDCRIGTHATLGRGVLLDDGVAIGRQSVLDLAGRRSTDMPDRSYITNSFPKGARIIDGASPTVSKTSSSGTD